MLEITVSVDVVCRCGANLQATVLRDGTTIEVEACEVCLEAAREEVQDPGDDE